MPLKDTQDTKMRDALTGSITGLMVGDALGLPYEGLSSRRIKERLPKEIRHAFILRKGMVSDDSEHTFLVARALIRSHDSENFGKSLASSLRLWLLHLPAGVGLATARALLKSCLGFSYKNSGVFSAGNGPAMRAPILGVVFGENPTLLKDYVSISTRITHTDPKAYIGALAVAQAAHMSSQNQYDIEAFTTIMSERLQDLPSSQTDEFFRLMALVKKSVSLEDEKLLISELNLETGVSGYIYHTLPIVLSLFFICKHDYRGAITRVIQLGGDTDTTAAILGGMIGANALHAKIPTDWKQGIADYPWSIASAKHLAQMISSNSEQKSRLTPLAWPVIALRNLLFLTVVLLHGFRRLLPPY